MDESLSELTDEQLAAYIGILQTMQMKNGASTAAEAEQKETKH